MLTTPDGTILERPDYACQPLTTVVAPGATVYVSLFATTGTTPSYYVDATSVRYYGW